MRATQAWTRQTELELVGMLPLGLDGLFLLPSIEPGKGELLMHALRIGAQTSQWFAPIAQVPARGGGAARRLEANFARSLSAGPDGLRLQVRRRREGGASWSLRDAEGAARARGSVVCDGSREVVDLSVTRDTVVVLGVGADAVTSPRYQVGIAARAEQAHVRWLGCEQRGWPELLLARQPSDLVQVELAVRATTEPGAARLVSWTIEPGRGSAESFARLECAVMGPTVWDDAGGGGFLCAVSAQTFAGESAPVLIKLDLATGVRETRSFGFARELGAPSIAEARETSAHAPRVYVLLPVYDAVRDCTECHALSADAMHAPSLAVVRLPEALRATCRTQWVAAARFCALDEALHGLTRALR